MKIKVLSYEECRKEFFLNLKKHAENKIKHWQRQKGYRCEIEDNLSEAGAEINYCQDALNALEKQIPKKVENCYTEDTTYGDEKAKFGSCCYCGSEVQEGMHFCMDCGQALDWSDTE